MPAAPTLLIQLLGPCEVRWSGSDTPIALRRLTRAALAYLAATSQPQPRQALMDMFCQTADDPRSALRSILSRIRQRLGPDILLADGNSVQFNAAAGWVDCLQFARTLNTDLSDLPLETLATTVDLYRGAFLEDV